jgi:beta-galactosidase
MLRLALPAVAQNLLPDSTNARLAPRARESINEGWRFHAGDADDAAATLHYDVLKPWILPTGNSFIKDPARRHVRPEGDPGRETAFVRRDLR